LSDPFVQFDLVGGRIDLEKKITFMDDIPVLEADLSQGSADLRAQLNALDSGELPRNWRLVSRLCANGALTVTTGGAAMLCVTA